MIAPVVLSAPAALAALITLAVALVAYRHWAASPVQLIALAKPARHRLAEAATPYRPHAWTDAPAPAAKRWSSDELDAALDAAEMAATEKLLAEMAAAERSWAEGSTSELVSA